MLAKIRTSRRKLKKDLGRGYILLEAMVAAALLSFGLAATVASLGHARAEVIRASNRVVAAQYAQAMLADQLALPQTTVGFTTATDTPEPGMTTTIRVDQSGLENSSAPALLNADELHLVQVTVSYQWTSTQVKTYALSGLKRNLTGVAGAGIPGGGGGGGGGGD